MRAYDPRTVLGRQLKTQLRNREHKNTPPRHERKSAPATAPIPDPDPVPGAAKETDDEIWSRLRNYTAAFDHRDRRWVLVTLREARILCIKIRNAECVLTPDIKKNLLRIFASASMALYRIYSSSFSTSRVRSIQPGLSLPATIMRTLDQICAALGKDSPMELHRYGFKIQTTRTWYDDDMRDYEEERVRNAKRALDAQQAIMASDDLEEGKEKKSEQTEPTTTSDVVVESKEEDIDIEHNEFGIRVNRGNMARNDLTFRGLVHAINHAERSYLRKTLKWSVVDNLVERLIHEYNRDAVMDPKDLACLDEDLPQRFWMWCRVRVFQDMSIICRAFEDNTFEYDRMVARYKETRRESSFHLSDVNPNLSADSLGNQVNRYMETLDENAANKIHRIVERCLSPDTDAYKNALEQTARVWFTIGSHLQLLTRAKTPNTLPAWSRIVTFDRVMTAIESLMNYQIDSKTVILFRAIALSHMLTGSLVTSYLQPQPERPSYYVPHPTPHVAHHTMPSKPLRAVLDLVMVPDLRKLYKNKSHPYREYITAAAFMHEFQNSTSVPFSDRYMFSNTTMHSHLARIHDKQDDASERKRLPVILPLFGRWHILENGSEQVYRANGIVDAIALWCSFVIQLYDGILEDDTDIKGFLRDKWLLV